MIEDYFMICDCEDKYDDNKIHLLARVECKLIFPIVYFPLLIYTYIEIKYGTMTYFYSGIFIISWYRLLYHIHAPFLPAKGWFRLYAFIIKPPRNNIDGPWSHGNFPNFMPIKEKLDWRNHKCLHACLLLFSTYFHIMQLHAARWHKIPKKACYVPRGG